MSLVFFTGSPPHYMAPPRLAADQINCGPSFSHEHFSGVVRSLRTPRGEYDVVPILGSLPREQLPAAVVCLVDSSRQSVPRNLGVIPCPKVLLVADTHHLDRPLRSLLDYISAEKFDRIVFLYDRHHAEIFRAAGVKNLFWFPGLTFPHSDAEVSAAQSPARAARIAMVGQAGAFHPRRLRLAAALARSGLPFQMAALPQREALDFYGGSLVTFNASLNGDLNLRTFEALAAGSALLTDRLSPAAGLDLLWQEGREVTTFASEEEMLERARDLLDHPAQAAEIAARGKAWFDRHFSAARRLEAFAALVYEGRAHPRFTLGGAGSRTISLPAGRPGQQAALAAYEALQEQHLREEQVRLAVHPALAAEAAVLAATLPRVSLTSDPSARTAEIGADWSFAGTPADKRRPEPALVRRSRQQLASGDLSGAFAGARQALEQDPKSMEALLLIAELAADSRQDELCAKVLARAAALDPSDPRVPLAALPGAGDRPARRLTAAAWSAWEARDLAAAAAAAAQALKLGPELADAHLVAGLATNLAAQSPGGWMGRGKALRLLAAAARLAPAHARHWRELAWARLRSGGLMAESIPAFRNLLTLDPAGAGDWHGLALALLKLGRPGEAEAALRDGLRQAPQSLLMMRSLGHALKQQGRIDEAAIWLARSYGGTPPARPRSAEKPLVIFAAQNGTAWQCMVSVYEAFLADPEWRTLVVAVPYNHPSFAESARADDCNAIFGFLRERGVPYVRWDECSLEQAAPDLLFLQNPYDSTRPPGWTVPDLVRAGHRLCYIPYAIEFGGNQEDVLYQFDLPLQQAAWAIAARNEDHRALFREHCSSGDRHVVVTGHPKFDQWCHGAPVAPDPALLEFAGGRPLVLWTPHFDARFDGTRWGNSYSTFLRWGEFIPAEFARRPDLAFVIRPHPCFFSSLEQRGIATAEELADWVRRCEAGGNVRFHAGGDYFPVLAAADALLSDGSSLMFEYGITGRPVCYTHNPVGPVAKLDYELDLDWLRRHCVWATSEDQIRAFLDGVARRSFGPSAEMAAEMRRRMGVCPGGAGAAFKRALEARWAAAHGQPRQEVRA